MVTINKFNKKTTYVAAKSVDSDTHIMSTHGGPWRAIIIHSVIVRIIIKVIPHSVELETAS